MVNTPQSWSCENDNKRTKVEVLLTDNNEWVEIPTSKVEHVVNEDGQADINRYARVDFPTEWEGESVTQYVNGYNPTDENISFVRIFLKDRTDEYVLEHFGFAGGVGPTSNLGISKMWVYDINELIKAVPANFSFKSPTPMEVLEVVTEQMNQVVGIMLDPVIIPPNTSDEVEAFIDRTIESERLFSQQATEPYSILADSSLTEQRVDELTESFSTATVATAGVNFDIDVASLQFDVSINEKVFQPNRDTLIDVLDWLSGRVEAKWHIEPFPNGGRIVMDFQPDARNFVQDDVIVDFSTGAIDEAGFTDTIDNYTDNGRLPVHNSVRLIKNTALADILPQTSVIIRGETTSSIGDNLKVHAGNTARNMLGLKAANFLENRLIPEYELIPEPRQPSRKFPEARARIEPFYQRARTLGNAEQLELTSKVVESEDRTLEGAERTARDELVELSKEESEGEIEMFGSPRLMPYDQLLVYPTCNTFVPNVAVPPIAYRVTEVRHVVQAGEEYRTSASVSLFVGKEDITVTSEMIDITEITEEE